LEHDSCYAATQVGLNATGYSTNFCKSVPTGFVGALGALSVSLAFEVEIRLCSDKRLNWVLMINSLSKSKIKDQEQSSEQP